MDIKKCFVITLFRCFDCKKRAFSYVVKAIFKPPKLSKVKVKIIE